MDTRPVDQHAPLVGHVLDGRYRVDALIAHGGMATVYRAVDLRLDRVVALKVMHPSLATDASFVERFIREAKAVARLAHPNVVGVFDQGAQGAYVYLAMEYVAGCTLRDVLRERGALSPRATLDVLEPVLAALGAAHRAGLVHRDMKPENVLIGDDGRVKVADFGLVRAVGTASQSTETVLGTVSYLAPEQIDDGAVDQRADVYACGIMLFEMLTGLKPYVGDNAAQVLHQHLNHDVPPPSAEVPGLAPALDELVVAATARDPRLRPQDAVAMLADVRSAVPGLSAAQLDLVPPLAREQERHDNAADRTSVIPRSVTVPREVRLPPPPSGAGPVDAVPGGPPGGDDGVHRTSVLPSPPPPVAGGPARGGARWRPRRGLWAALLALVVVLCVGAGVWYVNAGQFTQVPPLLSKTREQAERRLADEGLEVKSVEQEYSATEERGTVIRTDPGAGERIRDHGGVKLTVSRGPRMVDVPDLRGKTLGEARAALREAGLAPGMVTKAFSEESPKGAVTRTEPGRGERRKAGTTVALTLSKGAPVHVPDVSGMPRDEAREELEDAGLDVSVAGRRVFSDEDEGSVAGQSPRADSVRAEGDKVTLTLSKGPDLVEVPDVGGKHADEAKKVLEAKGFKVKVSRWFLGDTVWDQSTDGGDEAPRGSTVTIRVR
ncbi:Stk1 family PASTA domain-containing Ser/Thr kinase [Streptomyces sp. NPDC007088]|uniref:Stk1 family PASTA domain-containing Ser/Thr kinase n=1 Tax=Streptomyces sp. NPDC007088 TaxID=3364773 RepID=UPI0036A3B137